jgi:hypothetical protein
MIELGVFGGENVEIDIDVLQENVSELHLTLEGHELSCASALFVTNAQPARATLAVDEYGRRAT